jgi:hypothetical protein
VVMSTVKVKSLLQTFLGSRHGLSDVSYFVGCAWLGRFVLRCP